MRKWEAIKNGAFAAFTALQVAFSVVVDAIQEKIADLLASFIELGQFEIFGQSVDFTYGRAEALDTLVQSLRGATDGAAETGCGDDITSRLRAKFDASAQASQELSDGLFEGITAYFETHIGWRSGGCGRVCRPIRKAQREGAEGTRRRWTTARGLRLPSPLETERPAAEMGGDAVAAAIELASGCDRVDERQRDLTAAYNAGGYRWPNTPPRCSLRTQSAPRPSRNTSRKRSACATQPALSVISPAVAGRGAHRWP